MSTNHLVILLSLAAACMIGTLCLINTIPLLALICLGTSGALTFATLGEMTNR